MARKVRGFERVLDAPALFAVAYDEIGSSIYFALGIVAAQALGLTPLVLLATGILFLIVSLSYAEGTAAIPETGGAATFTRRAFNDLVGFTTGWVLFLDYLIVIALSTLFLPHYLAASLSAPSLTESPWDVMIAVLAIFLIVGVRLVRRTQIHTAALVLAVLDIAVQLLVVVLGLACVFSPGVLVNGFDFAAGPGLARPLLRAAARDARLHRARDRRQPGRGDARARARAATVAVLVDRARRDHDRADRDRGAVGVPGRGRLHRPRRRLDAGADRRHRDRVRRAPAGDDGRHPARRRRAVGRAHPLRRRHDGDHRLHAARPLDGRARDAAARVRPARAALARLPRGARRHRRGCDRDRRRHRDLRQGRPRLPRQRLLVRRAVRLHGGAARRDPAPPQGAGSRAPVPGQAGGR